MTQDGHELHFYYDEQGKPGIVIYDGMAYGYLYNLQGDVAALVDGTGTKVVEYTYDAWGKPTGKTGTMAGTLGTVQPFRYRGYVWDEETGLYYLRSRYYSPERCRFVSADALIKGNLFAYCADNPIGFVDPNGTIMSAGNDDAPFLYYSFLTEDGCNDKNHSTWKNMNLILFIVHDQVNV